MAMQKKNVDWAALELAYRTGRSFRLLAREFNISSTRIKQVADENNWVRDLSLIIAKKTQAKLNAANLNGNLNANKGTEREIVDATVQVQTNIVLAHRVDIQRARHLVVALLHELELEIESRHARDEAFSLDARLANGACRDSAGKPTSLVVQANTMKVLGDALKTLVALERQAFNIADLPTAASKATPPDKPDHVLGGLEQIDAAWDRILSQTPGCSKQSGASISTAAEVATS